MFVIADPVTFVLVHVATITLGATSILARL